VSNITSNIDVFFDNLQVTHIRGPLLEETHYYPFGLTMAGISSGILRSNYIENKQLFNSGNELQHQEFVDGQGLGLYDATHRFYDAQLGRFEQIDLMADEAEGSSVYSFGSNNPLLRNDPLGLKDTLINGEMVQRDKDLQSVTVTQKSNRATTNDDENGSKAGGIAIPAGGAIGLGEGLTAGSRFGVWGLAAAGAIWASVKIDGLQRKSADEVWYITYYKVGPNGEIYVGR
jgi:RHS repeat-associated protein